MVQSQEYFPPMFMPGELGAERLREFRHQGFRASGRPVPAVERATEVSLRFIEGQRARAIPE